MGSDFYYIWAEIYIMDLDKNKITNIPFCYKISYRFADDVSVIVKIDTNSNKILKIYNSPYLNKN